MIWIIAAFIGLISLWKPTWGVYSVVILWPAYLLRGTVLNIPTTALELSIYALAIAVVIRLATRRTPWNWVKMTPLTWVLLSLWVVAWILATLAANDREAALGAFKAWLVDPLLFAAMLAILIRNRRDRDYLMDACLASGALVALAGLVQLVGFRDTLQEGRLSSWFAPVANYAAMYLGPLLVLGVAKILHDVRTSIWHWIAVSLMGLALVATLSFGAYFAVAIGLLMVWWYLPSGKLKHSLLVGGVIISILAVTGLTQTKNFSQHFNFQSRSSGSVREQIWVTSWALIQKHPWFGIGPNNFEPAYRDELPHHYFPPLEWLVAQPHNLYLALWLETGLLGLVSFIGLFIYHAYLAHRKFLPDLKQRLVTIASLAALVTIMVHGLVDTPYFKNDLALLFLTIAILPWLGDGQVKD